MSEATQSHATTAQFDELQNEANPQVLNGNPKLDLILDIPVTLSLELGRAEMSIKKLLQLNQGSVVELDRFANEPLDVLVNGTLVAQGEVVVVNDKFGIRLTDVMNASDCLDNLQCQGENKGEFDETI